MPGGDVTCGSPRPSTLEGFLEHLLTLLHFIFCSLSETIFQDAEPLGLALYPSIFSFSSVISLHVPSTSGNFSQLYLAHLLLSFHLTFLLLRALYSVCLSLHSFLVSEMQYPLFTL